MSVRSVWQRCVARTRYAGPIGICVLLVLGSSLGRDLVRNSPVAAATPVATEQALRDRIASFGWVRVDLNRPTAAAVTPQPADWDQAAQSLLLGLSAGSYDTPLHVPGESSLTVRVNGAALGQLLTSPLVAGVAAAGNVDMRRVAAGGRHSLAIRTDGSLWAWGSNQYGQLGDGTSTNHLMPISVPIPGFGPSRDFAVTTVTLTPQSPSPGGLFDATLTVTNRGTAAGNAGTLQVWADQPSAATCGAVGNGSATLPTLAAGASQTVTLNGLSAGAAGAKTLRAFVDSAC